MEDATDCPILQAHSDGEIVRALGHGFNPHPTGSPEASAWDLGKRGLPLPVAAEPPDLPFREPFTTSKIKVT